MVEEVDRARVRNTGTLLEQLILVNKGFLEI